MDQLLDHSYAADNLLNSRILLANQDGDESANPVLIPSDKAFSSEDGYINVSTTNDTETF
jgi:hypothetical protein